MQRWKNGGIHVLVIQLRSQSDFYSSKIQTEMVNGGSYDIKIRVKSGIMKVYIDGCLKSEGEVVVAEAQDQEIYAVNESAMFWVDGELSNIRYFAIGDSCSAVDDTGIFEISDNGSCSCPDGFSGVTCQDATTPAPVCTGRVVIYWGLCRLFLT